MTEVAAILLAAAVTGVAALGAVLAAEAAHLGKEIVLAAAVIAGGFGYGAVVLAFRRVLPLGRLAR